MAYIPRWLTCMLSLVKTDVRETKSLDIKFIKEK